MCAHKNIYATLRWAVPFWIRKQTITPRTPLIAGFILNEHCNLHCPDCRVAEGKFPDPSYEEVKNGLSRVYARGARLLAIAGGEPFLWRDGVFALEDVIRHARCVGFKTISVYTNGTFPIETSADCVFVSLNGLKTRHDKHRGAGVFDKAMSHIEASCHRNLMVNYTIDTQSVHDLENVCNFISEHPKLRGIYFYFHTPYYGKDALYMDKDERRKIIDMLLALQRSGAPILNSRACLRAVRDDKWHGPSDDCIV